jgi:hypothetical protein
MSLSQRFNDVVSGAIVSVCSLFQDKRYPVLHPEYVESKFVPRVRVKLREEDGNIVKAFLPQRFGGTFEDSDLVAINNR